MRAVVGAAAVAEVPARGLHSHIRARRCKAFERVVGRPIVNHNDFLHALAFQTGDALT